MARRCSSAKKKALAGPMACAIHLRVTGLPVLSAIAGGCQESWHGLWTNIRPPAPTGGAAAVIRVWLERIFAA